MDNNTNITEFCFANSIEREELLMKKYDEFMNQLKSDELKDIVTEFRKTSNEHLKMLKDKMLKLNLKG